MKFKANLAWIDGAWASNVFLESDAQGFWTHIQANATEAESQGALALGCVIPGLVNAHSHAFQRAIAGLTENSERSGDDFGVGAIACTAWRCALVPTIWSLLQRGFIAKCCEAAIHMFVNFTTCIAIQMGMNMPIPLK